MNKTSNFFWTVIAVLIALLIGLIIGWQAGKAGLKECQNSINPLNTSYTIEGEIFLLEDGKYEGSKVKVKAWGEPIFGDLNSDGEDDAAMIFTFDEESDKVLYYIAAAIKDGNDYQGTNAVLIGDRVSPQNISVENSQIAVSYKDRGKDDEMTVSPYIEISRKFLVTGDVLVEVK